MLPGKTNILKCSNCECNIEQPTLLSGNTFGATIWSDGKQDAPMLPERHWLVKCPDCAKMLWIDELEKIGEVIPYNRKENGFNSKPYQVPEFQEMISFLRSENPNKKKESYLRTKIWWAGNDKRRGAEFPPEYASDEVENMNKLLEIMDDSKTNGRIMKGELLRQLGKFDESEKQFALVNEKNYEDVVAFLLNLVKAKNRYVAEIKTK
ncbi:MAG TPA: hypothetical protein VIS94_00020 [Desulfomonilia bacterium]